MTAPELSPDGRQIFHRGCKISFVDDESAKALPNRPTPVALCAEVYRLLKAFPEAEKGPGEPDDTVAATIEELDERWPDEDACGKKEWREIRRWAHEERELDGIKS